MTDDDIKHLRALCDMARHDAAFIAAAHEHMFRLLDEVERLQANTTSLMAGLSKALDALSPQRMAP